MTEFRGFGIYHDPDGWYAENDGGTCLGPFDERQLAEGAVDRELLGRRSDPHANYPRLLMIVPKTPAEAPVIDEATRKMTAAWRRQENSAWSWRGWHTCICGAGSDNQDHFVHGDFLTSSLCVHYLAFHRSAVPEETLARVLAFPFDGEEPTESELHRPKR